MGAVQVETLERGIVRVTLAHAASRNALGEELRAELQTVLEPMLRDPRVRVIVLGTGLDNFSVGGDLSRMDTLTTPAEGRARLKSAHVLARLILLAEKPIVAAVKGHAVGAGAGLALACDTIVMGESANIGFPFFRVGLVPDFAIAYTLSRRIGPAKARQALLYARSFKGTSALAAGIADEVVADDAVDARALELARELAAMPSHAVALTKRMLEHAVGDIESTLEFEAMAQPLCFAGADFAEGVAAFRDKRKPHFDPDV